MYRLAALLAAVAVASGQEATPPLFHAGVTLVHIDAEVTGPDGRILTGLTRDDFRVLDEGKPQPIIQFSAEEQPLDLILLFDISGSMRRVTERVGEAAREGLDEMRPGDRVSVMVFNTRARVVCPFTENLDEVERSIREDILDHHFGGGTFIQEGADQAALRFLHEKRTERRRAVLIITDDVGTRTRRESTVVRNFWEADAILSGLIINNAAFEVARKISSIISPQTRLTMAGMEGIAQKTGGDAIRSGDPGPAFQEAMHRIRTRYSLYYPLPAGKPGERRAIHVELTREAADRHPKSRIRARAGYIMPVSVPN
jgi:Ca-activated chloride channel family protein